MARQWERDGAGQGAVQVPCSTPVAGTRGDTLSHLHLHRSLGVAVTGNGGGTFPTPDYFKVI